MGWLINPHRPDQRLPLSPLTLNSGGELVFMSDMVPSFNANAQNLRMMFTQVAVTLENAETTFRRPIGPMVMQGLLNQDALLGFTTLDAPTLRSLALFSTQIDAMLNGVDRDGDSSIDAVPGEAAAAQLYTYMQQVGAIRLMSTNA